MVGRARFYRGLSRGGGPKVRLTLLEKATACLSAGTINTIKQQFSEVVETASKRRKEAEKALEAQLRQDLAARHAKGYHHKRATYPNHILFDIDLA